MPVLSRADGRTRLSALLLAAPLALAAGFAPAAPAAAAMDEPLPRFEDAICPGVVGLPVATAEYIVGRIRQNAEMLGRRMAAPDQCEANLVVAIVPDGQAFLQEMNRSQGYLFVEMTPTERRALLADEGPVHVFSRVFTRTRDGMRVDRRDSLTDHPQATGWAAHSKIYSPVRHDIVHAMVLFDAAAVRGLSITQLADYATVRALMRHAPGPGETGGDSILNLFDAGAAARPAGLTAFDSALLHGLYDGMANLNGTARSAHIANATGRDIAAE